MSEDEDNTLEKKKSKSFKMIQIEEWNNFVDVLTFLYEAHEHNQITIKDLYTKIEEIKNEK